MRVLTVTPQLRTTNLDRSIRFYTEQVGLELEFRHADFYAGIRTSNGSFHLKLVDSPDPSVAFVDEGGHLHLYLGVDDVDAFADHLRAAGVALVQPPCNTDWGTRELVFHDDEGHTIYAGMRVPAADTSQKRTREEARFKAAFPYQSDILALPVVDVDAAARWYARHFGMVEAERRDQPVPTVILERDGTRIGFSVNGGDASQDGAAILVSNIGGMRDELESNGVKTGNWRVDERKGQRLQVFFLVAPDGLCYYFHEPLQGQDAP